MKTANATTTEVMAIVSGDQNPAFTATGVLVGNSVCIHAGVGVGDGPMTVNVVLTEPPGPVAVTVYAPGDTDGTVTKSSIFPP